MTNKKRKINILILVLVIAAVIIGILVFTPFLEIIGLTEPGFCNQDPFSEDCICLEDEDKHQVQRGGIPRWLCEKKEKLVNVDIEGWEIRALEIAKQKWTENFPDCNMINCDKGNAELKFVWGYPGSYNERIVSIECIEQITATRGRTFSQITFDIINGETRGEPFCSDFTEEPDNFTEIDMHGPIKDVARSGYVDYTGSIYSKCGTGIGEKTSLFPINSRYEYKGIEILQVPENTVCEITNVDLINQGYTIKCDTNCPHEDILDLGKDLKLRFFTTDEIRDSWCGRQGTLGAVEPGMYTCNPKTTIDGRKYSLRFCKLDGTGNEFIADNLDYCNAPFWGTPNLEEVEFGTLE